MMTKKTRRPGRQAGFSLVELLIVVALLSVVMGAVFSQINEAQQNASTEQVRVDLFQESREFMDQMSRDLRSTGYPNPRNVKAGQFTGASEPDSQYLSAGLVKVDVGELWFEGDVDGTGQVSVIHYALDSDTSKPGCPCLRRSQAPKVDGDPVTGQTIANYQVEVQNVQNGTSDNPIFTAYLADGTKATLPITMNDNPSSPIANINSIRVSLTVQAKRPDLRTGQKPIMTLVSTVRLNNCSQAHGSGADSVMGCE